MKYMVSVKITRLIRPSLALNKDIQHTLVPTIAASAGEVPCANDLSELSSSFDDMLSFPTEFG